jgi:cation-transporting ATPase E
MNEIDTINGLTQEQVEERKRRGLINNTEKIETKTIGHIIKENLFTQFNILNGILAGLILLVGSFKNLMFMGVIFANILIGIIQEIRAKRAIDKLSPLASPKARVLRDGEKQEIAVYDLVLDDILVLAAGDQVCADCVILDGECEINAALITGESDTIPKKAGEHLLSGSFLSSGSCRARIEHVGKDNYTEKITKEANYPKLPNSEIMIWTNKLIKWIGFAIVPIGLMLFFKQYFLLKQPLNQSVISTIAALIGMIPEGLVLLTSVVLAVSVVRLAKQKALIQELYSVETLARVDTLCLDKTGTITENTMQLEAIVPLCAISQEEVENAISALVNTLKNENPTNNALHMIRRPPPDWKCINTVSFSSERKWSGASFEGKGSFLMGAGDFMMKDQFEPIRPQADEYSRNGYRVLLLAHTDSELDENRFPQNVTPLALILLSDRIRANARETLEYFFDQGVDIKILSGDNVLTVSSVAKRAGLWDADNYVDASKLESYEDIREAVDKYSVFGRVTPQQKHDIIKALKEKHHTVAMAGDGVNDVLALKESDCSIAMACGSDAARTISQVILMDSNFAEMPKIVSEGRRSINNLQRSAALYLVKTMFTMVISVMFLFISVSYPFQPIQFTLINALTIAVPSFILALEPNDELIQGKFIVNILKKAAPGTVSMVFNMILLVAVAQFLPFTSEQISTLAVIITAYAGFLTLFRICMPFDARRTVLFFLMVTAFIIALTTFRSLFAVVPLTLPMVFVLIPMMMVSASLMVAVLHLIHILADPKK